MRDCTKTILHPEVGPLALASEVLLDSTGEQSLVIYAAQPGTDTAEKLELLRVLGGAVLMTPRATRPEEVSGQPVWAARHSRPLYHPAERVS